MKRRVGFITAALLGLLAILYVYLWWPPARPQASAKTTVPRLNHVFVIVMENHSLTALPPSQAPYIHELVERYGYDQAYHGVTHVSLPNYVALISGRTFHSHSDNPDQTFGGPTLVAQLARHHISWQAVMQSLPATGYPGNWYPEPKGRNPTAMPLNALYAKKHDPFMLFPAISRHEASHVVPWTTFQRELSSEKIPRFVWITPNLCSDMHGQPVGSTACPVNHPKKLINLGDQFLQHVIPSIVHSPAFTGHSVIFITWDEAQTPRSAWNLGAWKAWLSPGPQSPRILGIPVGGGSVPLIAILPGHHQPPHIALWADHYALLKTIEQGFGLSYLGHAKNNQVPLLGALLHPKS